MSESNEERSPGFKRSLIGKLIAVAIFVAGISAISSLTGEQVVQENQVNEIFPELAVEEVVETPAINEEVIAPVAEIAATPEISEPNRAINISIKGKVMATPDICGMW